MIAMIMVPICATIIIVIMTIVVVMTNKDSGNSTKNDN